MYVWMNVKHVCIQLPLTYIHLQHGLNILHTVLLYKGKKGTHMYMHTYKQTYIQTFKCSQKYLSLPG